MTHSSGINVRNTLMMYFAQVAHTRVLHGTIYAVPQLPIPPKELSRARSAHASLGPATCRFRTFVSPSRPSLPQTELSPSCREALNFTTSAADRCQSSGGLFNETQACLVTVLGVVSMRWREWQMLMLQQWWNNRYFSLEKCSLHSPLS